MSFFYNIADKIKYALKSASDMVKDSFDIVDDKVNIPIYHNFKEARQVNAIAENEFEQARYYVNLSREHARKALEQYGYKKLEVYDKYLRNFLLEYYRIKGIDFSSCQLEDSVYKQSISFSSLQETYYDYIDGLKKLVIKGDDRASIELMALGGDGSLAEAYISETGISTVSEAAASNATFAFLDGRKIAAAAGKGGVVLGAAVLGGLVAIPALLVGGLALNAKSQKALIKAEQDLAQVNAFVSESKAAIAVLSEIKEQAEQLKSTLTQLSARLGKMTKELKFISDSQIQKRIMKRTLQMIKKAIMRILNKFGFSVPEWLKRPMTVDFTKFTDSEKNHLLKVVSLAQTTKNLMETDLLSDEGTVSIESKDVLKNACEFL